MRRIFIGKLFIKGLFGFHCVEEGTTCLFSKKFWDVHDYYKVLGGDGVPKSMYTYKCWGCGKEFEI